MGNTWWIIAVFAGEGALFIAIAIPLIRRRIPPNLYCGFRTKKTLSSPDIWYPANEYMGKLLRVDGVCVVVASICTSFIPSVALYSLINAAVMFSLIVKSVVLGYRYVGTL